ncbi:MAG: hypothetical protein HYT65_00160 [Candidatus Yanofskybacteria bacterium]|nr:hypothetical protein [Candidatus Yanofskybacteria bacterium]
MENEINIAPPVQPEPTLIQPKPKTRLIVLLIVFGVAVAGYFVSAKFLGIWLFEAAAPVSVPTFTPRPLADELAGWQTYRNEEYGFEFQYPPNWYTRIDGAATEISSQAFSQPFDPNNIFIELRVDENNYQSLSLLDYTKQKITANDVGSLYGSQATYNEVTLNGKKFIKVSVVNGDDPDGRSLIYTTLRNPISLYAFTVLGNETNNIDIVEAILSSIKIVIR